MSTQAPQLHSIPRINDPAPDFTALSTHGEITLSQYTTAGKWVLLFSHPADFTSEAALHERLELGKKGEVNQTDWYFSKKKI